MDCSEAGCGDGQCTGDERASTCPVDCFCGNGTCEPTENNLLCPSDCVVGQCGNQICESGENNNDCPGDCPDAVCGNGACESGEHNNNCPGDCTSAVCGNGACESGEDNNGCPGDCPTAVCGNGACESGEHNNNCPGDCTAAVCGNGACESGEDTWSCLQDCQPACGNDVHDFGEECDGTDLGGNDCVGVTGHAQGALSCDASCQFVVTDCSTCGDGTLEGSEQCDVSDLGGQTCQGLGQDGGSLGCTSSCMWDLSGCHYCGDGVVQSPELCDGQALGPGLPTCVELGREGGTVACDVDCLGVNDGGCYDCGDGICDSHAGESHLSCQAECGFVDAVSERGTTCALRGDGTVWCWGLNFYGWLGDGSTVSNPVPQQTIGITTAVALAGGTDHSCALLADGTIRCWGSGEWGQLGDGLATHSATPVTVAGISDAVSIGAGDDVTCAVRSDGSTWCWGRDTSALGVGPQPPHTCDPSCCSPWACAPTPVQVTIPTDGVALGVSANGTAVVHADGSVRQWGLLWNQATLGPVHNWLLVTTASFPLEAPVLMAGATVCAFDAADMLHCWGSNASGQLGIGSTVDGTDTPTAVQNLPALVTAAGAGSVYGTTYICALDHTGQVHCWGENGEGQLGDGTAVSTTLPSPVAGVTNAVAIAAGNAHVCAVLDTGVIVCWGDCAFGRLGDGRMSCSGQTLPQSILMP